MNERNQYDYRGPRQGRRPDEDNSRQQERGARSGRSFDDDSPRYYGSGAREDFDEMGRYDAGERSRQYGAEQDDEQYLGGYGSERGTQYYNAPRQHAQYNQPHDPPGRDAEPYDHPAQGRFGTAANPSRGNAYYGGAYGPEDFRQGSGMRNWQGQGSNQFARQQRNFAGQGGRSASNRDFDRGYGSFRQQQYQPGYGASLGGYARDFDEGDYDQAFGGYSPSQHGFGDSWSGYGRGGYGPAYGQDYEQDLMGTTNSTVGSGGFSQGPATRQRQGYGRGMFGGGYNSQAQFAGQGYENEYDRLRRESQFGKGPKGYVRSDDRLREDLSERLMRDHAIDASDISIEVKNGIVTLTGSVNERRLKHYVEDLAEACSGVRDVDNRITVRPRSTETTAATSGRPAASSNTPAGSGSLGGSTTGEDGAAPRKN